jgi:hypothetical protein
LNPPVSQAENCFHGIANGMGFQAHLKVLAKAAENKLGFGDHQVCLTYYKSHR